MFPGFFPGFWATDCLGYPKKSNGAKGTRKASSGQPLPGADLGGPVVQDTGWGEVLQHPEPELKPGFCALACLPASGSSQGRGCQWGTEAVTRGPPHTAGSFLRWQRKVLMNHAVVVSPCLAQTGGWEIACHSDFRAILGCKEGSIHQLPRNLLR